MREKITKEKSLYIVVLISAILGASGLAMGLFSIMQVQAGDIRQDDNINGVILQVLSNSTSEFNDTVYGSPHTLLTLNINIHSSSAIYCFATINIVVSLNMDLGWVAFRLWLDDSIELANNSLLNYEFNGESSNTIVFSGALQYLYQGLNEGTHNIKLQYWIEQANGIAVNFNNSISTLTVMEIAT